MHLIPLLIQLLGLLGMILNFISYQCKNTRNLYLLQAGSGIFFALNFYFLGAYTGALLNALNLFRSGSFALFHKTRARRIAAVLLCLAYLAAGIVTYSGWLSCMVIFAQLIGTVAMATDSGKVIRLGQLFCVSPLWLIHNVVTHSLGGVLTELFNIVSVLFFIFRFGWKKFLNQPSA